MADKSGKTPKGQQKTYQITNPATGETKEVTQEEWRTGQYARQGWQKPAEMPEEPEVPEDGTAEVGGAGIDTEAEDRESTDPNAPENQG